MIAKIKTLKGGVILNLVNVDYNATPEDIIDLYPEIKIKTIESNKQGTYTIWCLDPNDGIKILQGPEKVDN